jgi:molybdate transport system substrate-binding protein
VKRLALLIIASLAAWGCGGDGRTLVVGVASSLAPAARSYAADFERDHSSVKITILAAGSDEIAARVRTAGGVDVVASASKKISDALYAEGLTTTPIAIAGNRLVVVASSRGPVHSIADLAVRGRRLVVGSAGVPIGDYTAEAFERLGISARVDANVISREPNVLGVIGKVTTGAADAGVVYASDAKGLDGVRVIAVPARAQPAITYGAATRVDAPPIATTFVQGLIALGGQATLRSFGFEGAS